MLNGKSHICHTFLSSRQKHERAISFLLMCGTLSSFRIEPSIGLRKYDRTTGGWVDNPAIPGEWVAVSITLPLRNPCLFSANAVAGRISLPRKHMTRRERAHSATEEFNGRAAPRGEQQTGPQRQGIVGCEE